MEHFLLIFVLIPALGFLTNVFIPKTNEKLMSNVAFTTMGLQFVVTFFFTCYWFVRHQDTLYTKEITFYRTDEIELFIDFCFDKISVVYLMVGAFLSFLIIAYSRTYLHREGGYKRFFNTVMLFYLGYNVLVLSANLATFFIGWEIAGISSFLLIGFYRNRYIPVRNAVKIFSIYRNLQNCRSRFYPGHLVQSPDLASEYCFARI
jgi:NADH-quinone oxidoreductase subunit L